MKKEPMKLEKIIEYIEWPVFIKIYSINTVTNEYKHKLCKNNHEILEVP
jgi:hypothetical protein